MLGAALGIMGLWEGACREPTVVVVDVKTTAACSDVGSTTVTVGHLGEVESKFATSSTDGCEGAGSIGRVVVQPSGSNDDELAVKVITGIRQSADQCHEPDYKGCIVSRRAIRYSPHTSLRLVVTMDLACKDVPCGATQTCVHGDCRSAAIADPSKCAGPDGCDEAALAPPVDAGPGGKGDATIGEDANVPDAGPPRDLNPPPPVTIAPTGATSLAVGFGVQAHSFFARNDGSYWLFYTDGTPGIRTRTSKDFRTWTDGDTVSLGGVAGTVDDGSNFSLAYDDIAGHDVVHILANTKNGLDPPAVHLRGTVSVGHFKVTKTISLANTNIVCDAAGPTTLISADHHVYDMTAWMSHSCCSCDSNLFVSQSPDTGDDWSPGFAFKGFVYSIPNSTYAHQLVELPSAGPGVVFGAWPDMDPGNGTLFDSIGWALSTSIGVGGPNFQGREQDVTGVGYGQVASTEAFFSAGGKASYNDWSICRLADNEVYAVRHVGADAADVGLFQQARYDGAMFQSSTAPPTVAAASNSGVVLLGDGVASHGMLLVVIGRDNALHIFKWTNGQWATLPVLPSSGALRHTLSGTGCAGPGARVFWTEGANAPYAVKGVDLSGLLF
jgi:hypothetical protein